VATFFPWGENALVESWIEVGIGPERYWLEIPYGFYRNPNEPLPPSIPGGSPQLVSVMKPLTAHDHVERWQNVRYHLGRTQDGRDLSLIQSNPCDAKSELELYRFPEPQTVYSPHTDVRILDPGGTVIEGRCLNLHLDDNHLRRTDTFEILTRGGDASRCWGHIEVRIDDTTYRLVVPSSVYKYIHGHAPINGTP
jgi:hypothetical protein